MDDVNSALPAQSPGPRLVSASKRDANRQNAKHSTGPLTAEGKALSRRNAVTHGCLATDIVVNGAGGGESVEQFVALHEGLRTHFRPANLYEEQLVEQLAVLEWQRRRVLRYETAILAQQLEALRASVEQAADLAVAEAMCRVGAARAEALAATSRGVWYVITVLEDLRGQVQQNGQLTDAARTELVEHLGETSGLVRAVTAPSQAASTPATADANHPAGPQGDIVGVLNRAIRALRRQKILLERREAQEFERRRGCVALPEDAAMDKILRYGGEMERRRLKTVHELERVQRLRGGEAVPPPMAVDVQGDSV